MDREITLRDYGRVVWSGRWLILATTVAYMVTRDWRLTVVALVVLPAFLLPARQVGGRTFEARKETQAKLSEMTSYMQEILGISGILLVKAFAKRAIEAVRKVPELRLRALAGKL